MIFFFNSQFSFKLPTKKEIEEIKKCPKHEKERLVECPRDRCEDNGPPWDDRLFFIKCDNKTKNNCPKDEKEKCQVRVLFKNYSFFFS